MSEALRLLPAPVLLPERRGERPHWLDRIEHALMSMPARLAVSLERSRLEAKRDRVLAVAPVYEAMDEAALGAATVRIRARLRREGLESGALLEAFALIREWSSRTLGLRHYPQQVLGGLVMAGGGLAEMDTGEGKSLTATLAAGAAAMAGIPTHVVTVNDYLAGRDAETLGPLYRALGLTVGVIRRGLSPDERRAAYAADVTYCQNSELAFDWMKDRMALGRSAGNLRLKVGRLQGAEEARTVMRGLHFAIVDEADSVLVDEARTPLIIASETSAEDERKWAEGAFRLADTLSDRHWRRRPDRRVIELTPAGKARLAEAGEAEGGIWRSKVRREEAVRQALSARTLFHEGDHYIVRDDKVMIVDEYSGRVMPDRSWNDGMHQLIELKEGVEVTGRKQVAIRTSYQRFFRRYRRLAGMTGTAREVTGEMRAVYRLPVVRVAPQRPLRRIALPPTVLASRDEKLRMIAGRVADLSAAGRPVLIGTRSIAASEAVSAALSEAGIPHRVLNAEAEAEEAAIVAEAGRAGCVTVATNMAGRGVDIALGPGVAEAGGLHVILSERHDARRIDRQLHGRAGRQGDPGSTEEILSLEDALLEQFARRFPARVAPRLAFRWAQMRAERLHGRMRKDLMKMDEDMGRSLSFAGPGT